MHPKKLILRTAIALLVLTVCAGYAAADIVYYGLDKDQFNLIDPYNYHYGYVEVNLINSTTANISFLQEASSPFSYYGTYSGPNTPNALVGVEVKDVSVSVSNITSGVSFHGTNAAVDNMGNYDVTLETSLHNLLKEVDFTLTNTSGGTWASASDVLGGTSDSHGHLVAAYVFGQGNDTHIGGGSGLGEYHVDDTLGPSTTGPASVPEPATLLLLGSGLIGLGGFGRKKFIKK